MMPTSIMSDDKALRRTDDIPEIEMNGNTSNGHGGAFVPANDFQKLLFKLQMDPTYKREMFVEKLISFYKIGREIGAGNFSQVKVGLHLLTKGIL